MSRIVTEVHDAFRAARVDDELAKAAAAAIAGRDVSGSARLPAGW